jgi:glutamate-1-semialdehyde aminotransferase
MKKNKKNSKGNSGQKLYRKAKKIIPGGNMLLSKRPEMFAPDIWPSYFSKAKGINVWDLDGNKFTDFSIMGIGTNILGYGRKEVDEAVMQTIRSGNLSTLNCPEEVELAEKLVEINPWSSRVRFARTGGEANSIAIRIARAATNRDKVAVCGYHGWHDWYLSANIAKDSALDGHLLPGLITSGVPRKLEGLTVPFKYGDIDSIAKLIKSEQFAAVKMEVARSTKPDKEFLEEIRKLTKKHGTVLIFDECTSGFRECYGGLHRKVNVEPDMAMFGKTLGNGYAITCVIGSDDIMLACENSFISSTFWTERIGPTAAIKTLEIMKQEKPWIFMNQQASKVRKNLSKIAKKNNLEITIGGLPVLTNFSINHPDWLKIKTYITQEALKHKMLISNSFYISALHTDEELDKYYQFIELIFRDISNHLDNDNFCGRLEGPHCHEGFQRLN